MTDILSSQIAGQSNKRRKKEHLEIALGMPVDFGGVNTCLEDYRFIHQALPEIDLAEVDVSASLFGKRLNAPLLISSMVGGIDSAGFINHNLARAAQEMGVAMGVGSQRIAIEDYSAAQSYQVRDIAPDILLFANLGAVQLNYGYGVYECRRAVEMIEADALILHLNPLQEALQHNGNTNFSGLLRRIEQVCRELQVPVIIKEVGWGISETVARKLADAGVAGIDVAGAGGTSWSEIEKYRAHTETGNNIAAAFACWGIPTSESIARARQGAGGLTLIASGGLRNGIDVAKVLALGADAAGIAVPLLKAASISAEEVIIALHRIIQVLRISMFCTGVKTLKELKYSPCLERKGKD